MNKEQWQRIEEIFYSAMELPPGERAEFIRRTCADDETLLREVQSLVNANRKTESFLEPPAPVPQTRASVPSLRMKHCPKCGEIYPAITRLCSTDSELLSLKDPYHLVGSTLLDKYKVLALVGVGGMGAVYCAQHLGIDRRVALKILQPNVAIGNEYVVELFEREAKLAGRLTHENIVDVKDAGHTPDGIAYIAMEWLEGRTLDEELAKQGRFGFRRAVGIIRQIASALSAAHAERIIHRDLKPANIMLVDTPDGRDHVKVLDFGIGKILTETTGDSPISALVGTPQYASPEQLTVGGHVDGRSDLYSLGVIFYRLISGQLPFKCSSMSELLQIQLTGTPQSLSGIRPETPPEIETLINRLLAKNPASRPQNAGELSRTLDRIQGELKIAEPEEEEFALAGASLPAPIGKVQTAAPAAASVQGNSAFLRYGVALASVVLAGGYGLYRYRSSEPPVAEVRRAETPSPVPTIADDSSPSPAATGTPVLEQATTPVPSPTDLLTMPAPAINRAQLQLNQQKAAEHLQRARALYAQLDYQNALRECDESLKLNPRQTEAHRLKQKINGILKVLNSR